MEFLNNAGHFITLLKFYLNNINIVILFVMAREKTWPKGEIVIKTIFYVLFKSNSRTQQFFMFVIFVVIFVSDYF